jgi:inositol phosphorylceramide mannosyltransferase catalytic subunit
MIGSKPTRHQKNNNDAVKKINQQLFAPRNTNNVVLKNSQKNELKVLDHLTVAGQHINNSLESPSNIIITLTSIPARLIDDNIHKVIDSLYQQNHAPKLVVLNVCEKYKRKFNIEKSVIDGRINLLKSRYPKLIINYSEDYGPATKILGLIHSDKFKSEFEEQDIVIVVDDDCPVDSNMTYHYELCYQLYNCDCIFINERDLIVWDAKYKYDMNLLFPKNIYYDNYQNFVYGWLTYSFRAKHIDGMLDFFNHLTKTDPNVWYHDDLFFTLYYRHMELYACGINLIFNKITDDVRKVMATGLHMINGAGQMRKELEKKLLNILNIDMEIKHNYNYVTNKKTYHSEQIIPRYIAPRHMLRNVRMIDYVKETNFHDTHIDIKHYNDTHIIVTITHYKNIDIKKNIFFLSKDDQKYGLAVPFNNFSKKQSFFVHLANEPENQDGVPDVNIIQTAENNNVSLNRLYSVSSITSNIPYLPYIFYDNNDRIKFIKYFFPSLVKLYGKLTAGAYKADLFRALYIYKNGGLYFDCKSILFSSIIDLFNDDKFFVQDIKNGHICVAPVYVNGPGNENYKKYLIDMLYNIHTNNYTKDALSVTGPGLLGKHIKNNIVLKNCMRGNDWMNSFITKNEKIIIKNSYAGYYQENNYINTTHYSAIWNSKKIFDQYKISLHSKLLQHIVWINLDRSLTRRDHIQKLLKSINVPNTRIPAVDGKLIDGSQYNRASNKMTNYEIACLLSHIKAITKLSQMTGDYFLVCEDDIVFDNTALFIKSFDRIIKDIPVNHKDFDILMLQKTHFSKLDDLYICWNQYNKKYSDGPIAGATAYIISKKGVDRVINELCTVDYNNNLIQKSNLGLEQSDVYIYTNVKTIVYRYNYMATMDLDSEIHPDHLNWHTKSAKFQFDIIAEHILDEDHEFI